MPTEQAARVGERVRALRKARGMSATHLAAEAEVHRSRLSRLELGTVDASVDMLVKLARALKVDVSVLLGESVDTGRYQLPQPRRMLVSTSADPLGRDINVVEVTCGDFRHYEVMAVGDGGYVYSYRIEQDRLSALREAELLAAGE